MVGFGDCHIFAKCIYYLLKLPLRPNYKIMKSVVCFGDCFIFEYYLLKLPLRPKFNYKIMKSVVCFGDCYIFAKIYSNYILKYSDLLKLLIFAKIYSNYHLHQIIRY